MKKLIKYGAIVIAALLVLVSLVWNIINVSNAYAFQLRQEGYNATLQGILQTLDNEGQLTLSRVNENGDTESIILIPKQLNE